jgi:HEAT repeat protein
VWYLIENGALAAIKRSLDHSLPRIREQAAWAIGNIAGVSRIERYVHSFRSDAIVT